MHQKNKDLITWLHFEYEQKTSTEKTQVQLSVNSDKNKSWTTNMFMEWKELCSYRDKE